MGHAGPAQVREQLSDTKPGKRFGCEVITDVTGPILYNVPRNGLREITDRRHRRICQWNTKPTSGGPANGKHAGMSRSESKNSGAALGPREQAAFAMYWSYATTSCSAIQRSVLRIDRAANVRDKLCPLLWRLRCAHPRASALVRPG